MTLLIAGSSKVAGPERIRRTIEALGVPWTSTLACALGVVELSAGLALLLLPGQWITASLVATLALVFASSGALALIRNARVDCGCFGSLAAVPLGWRQLALTPAWLATAFSVVASPVALPDGRLTLSFAAIAIASVLTLLRLFPLFSEHRVQRRAIEGS
jgi:hypothetical protein